MKALVIAGVASGVGKTTVATGIMAALTRRAFKVQPYKVGPDYIDPTYHLIACNTPSRNLDSWMLESSTMLELFHHSMRGKDIAIIEGVMGLFDGRSGDSEEGSTAQVAKLLGTPVILVLDAGKMARSAAAMVMGYQRFDPELKLAGVILNGIAGPGHLQMTKEPTELATGLPVVGYLPRSQDLELPERHLGLIPTVEKRNLEAFLLRLQKQVENTIDLESVVRLAAQASVPHPHPNPSLRQAQGKLGSGRALPPSRGKAKDFEVEGKQSVVRYSKGKTPRGEVAAGIFPLEPIKTKVVIGVARDKAFSFYYQDNLDLLEAWGAGIIPFSPLKDREFPRGIGGIYLGGGFPELYLEELANNQEMINALRQAATKGMPIYGECGGLMYLGREITDLQGKAFSMVGLIPARSSMKGSRLTLGYRTVVARKDGPLLGAGEQTRGHEFHWSILESPPPEVTSAYNVIEQAGRVEGFHIHNILASYVHLHFAAKQGMAKNFVEACHRWQQKASG